MPAIAPHTIALFRFPGQESADNARRLASTAKAAGYKVAVFGFWPDGYDVSDNDHFLLEENLGSAPRMSAWAFRDKHGFEVDTLSLAAHTFATEALSPELILAESVWHQRLRGFADVVIEALIQLKPSHVFVPHGAEVLSRLINAVAARMQYPLLFWESGFLPGHLYLDHRAPHFFRGLCSADVTNPSPTAEAFGASLKHLWLNSGQSKYAQSGHDDEAFSHWLRASSDELLFIPAQVPTDANVVTALHHHEDLLALYHDMIANVPDGWRIAFKPHPKAEVDWSSLANENARLFIGDISIRHAITAADAVLAHSSNTGLEALMLGKPVLTTGSPIYNAVGLTQSLATGPDLSGALTAVRPAPPQAVDTLLGHIAQTVLLADGDTRQLARQLQSAKPSLENYLRHYPLPLQKKLRAALALDKGLRRNQTLAQSFSALSEDDAACLSPRITPEVVKDRPFGGPVLGDEWTPPVIGNGPTKASSLAFPRLENLPSPELEVTALCRRAGGCIFSVRLRPDGGSPDIQSFSVDSLLRLFQPTAADFQIVTWPDGDHASVYLGVQGPVDPSAQAVISFPASIFKAGQTAMRIAVGDVLPLKVTHAHYGPYARLPEGEWSVSRLEPQGDLRGLRGLHTLFATRKMKLQVLEHAEGSEPQIIHETGWLKPKGVFQTRPGMKYELRSCMPKTKSKAKGPRFYGFAISSASGVPIISTSAP